MALDDTKTLAERILRLEQKLQRLEKREGRPPVELFDNSAIRNRKIIDDLLVHNHTHANLSGLDADDHTQYTKHPATSTDNAIVRWDGTGGRTLQNSSVAIDDNGKLSGDGLDGWIYDTDTWSYVSATSFKITGKDVRYRFPKGTKIKLVQSGSTKYFYVVATDYSADTTITITGGSDYTLASTTISGQAYSYAAAPQGFPLGTSTFVPLTTPLTSTSWDGDTKTTADRAIVDLSAVFGVPDGVKAVLMTIQTQADAVNEYIHFGPNSTYNYALICRTPVASQIAHATGVVPCDSNGDVYCYPSGTIVKVKVYIWGYWL